MALKFDVPFSKSNLKNGVAPDSIVYAMYGQPTPAKALGFFVKNEAGELQLHTFKEKEHAENT